MAKSIDAFLNHKTNSFKKTQTLKNWTDAGEIDTWMHTEIGFEWIWVHSLPKLVTITDKDTNEEHAMLWGTNLTSPTSEELIKKQWDRDDDGDFETEITDDLLTNLWRYVYQLVQRKELSWIEPLFHFEGEDKVKGKYIKAEKTIHAAGIYGGFKNVETDDEKEELRNAGIFLTEAWNESFVNKCKYVFVIVDNEEPGEGLKVAVQTSLLGDRVKQVIKDRMMSKGKEEGNPMLNPFCIKWIYRDKEKEIQKKYHAVAMDEIKLTPKIKELIYGPPPSIQYLLDPYDQKETLAFLQEHAVGKGKKLPWEKLMPKNPKTAKGADFEFGQNATKQEEQTQSAPESYTTSTGIIIPANDAVECDNPKCNKPMDAHWNKCVECGEVYDGKDADGNPLIDPPSQKKPEPPKEIVQRTRRRVVGLKAGTKAQDEEEPNIPFGND